MPGSLACRPFCLPSYSLASCPAVCFWGTGVCRGGCAGVPGMSADLSPFIVASCPVARFRGIGVRQGGFAGVPCVSPDVSPFMIAFCPIVPRAVYCRGSRFVPKNSSLCQRTREIARSCLPSRSPLVSLFVACAAWEPDGGAGGPFLKVWNGMVLPGVRELASSSLLEVGNRMVAPGVPGTRKFLSPVIISSCLPSCSLGTGWWCQGSRELVSSCLPS